jgi:lysophospholipase L1-like esterase
MKRGMWPVVLLAIAAAAWPVDAARAQSVSVFVLAGQSNMAGAGRNGEEPDGYAPQANIWYDASNVVEHTDDWIPLSYGPFAGQPGIGWGFGPELSFGHDVAEAFPDEQIAIVKVTRGGTNLSYWAVDGNDGHEALFERIDTVGQRLDDQQTAGEIDDWAFAGFVWMQGEGDADGWGGTPHETYAERFDGLVAEVRQATSQDELPVVLGRISEKIGPFYDRQTTNGTRRYSQTFAAANPDTVSAYPGRVLPDTMDNLTNDDQLWGPIALQHRLDRVRLEQAEWAETIDSFGAWVDTDDLPMTDSWHFNGAGQTTLGERFADAYLAIAAEPIPGDFNGDGAVTDADYTIWADHCGQSGGTGEGDANGDGVVTEADYTIWADHYGTGTGAVPEPATIALLALAGLAALRRWK